MPDRMSEPTVHDPRVLRAIAHPARNRILNELSAAGPLRAADVARLLDLPANQASFHLRQLAKYGLVVPAPDAARDGRDRVWKLVNEEGLTVNLQDLEGAPGGKAAVTVWRRSAGAWAHHLVDAAYSASGEDGTHRTITNQPLKLTKEEAVELSGELDRVLQAWADRTRGQDDERSTYLLFSILQPYPDDELA